MAFLSIISPVYNTGITAVEMVQRLFTALRDTADDYEIILIDDGSRDDSWNLIAALAKEHSSVKAVKFSRNFGQHAAITAGLARASGEWMVVMDSDLQDLPESIPTLYNETKKGF